MDNGLCKFVKVCDLKQGNCIKASIKLGIECSPFAKRLMLVTYCLAQDICRSFESCNKVLERACTTNYPEVKELLWKEIPCPIRTALGFKGPMANCKFPKERSKNSNPDACAFRKCKIMEFCPITNDDCQHPTLRAKFSFFGECCQDGQCAIKDLPAEEQNKYSRISVL